MARGMVTGSRANASTSGASIWASLLSQSNTRQTQQTDATTPTLPPDKRRERVPRTMAHVQNRRSSRKRQGEVNATVPRSEHGQANFIHTHAVITEAADQQNRGHPKPESIRTPLSKNRRHVSSDEVEVPPTHHAGTGPMGRRQTVSNCTSESTSKTRWRLIRRT